MYSNRRSMRQIICMLAVVILMVTGCAKSNETISSEDNIVTTIAENTAVNEENVNDAIDSNEDTLINEDDKEDIEAMEEVASTQEDTNIEDDEVIEVLEVVDYDDLKPNEVGDIIVVMYHGISDNPPYHRTLENFNKDLQYMYDNGYRLISMSDYINHTIDVEAGYTPIVLTFDDGLSTTFSLIEVDGEFVVNEETAIGAIEAFAKKHPDFGKTAALYLNGGKESTFRGAGSYEDRLNWLVDNGYEIGNHLYSHPFLNKLDAEGVQMEIGKVDQMVEDAIDGYTIESLTYPYGIRPNEEDRIYIEAGTYNENSYSYSVAFREAYRNKLMPSIHVDFEPYNCSRVRGSEGEFGDLWWAFGVYENNPEKRYISDGDPDLIVVPEDKVEDVDIESLNGKEVITY